jgi:hypothetical protein
MDQGVATVIAAIIAVVGAVGGVWVGGRISANAARDTTRAATDAREADRLEARQTRFHDELRQAATNLYQLAGWHRKQRSDQLMRWRGVAMGHGTPESIPPVEGIEGVFKSAAALDLIASRPVCDAAWRLYKMAAQLDSELLTYTESRDRHGPKVDMPVNAALEMFPYLRRNLDAAALAFGNAVRNELGMQPVSEPDAPSEDSEDFPDQPPF